MAAEVTCPLYCLVSSPLRLPDILPFHLPLHSPLQLKGLVLSSPLRNLGT